MKLSQHIAVEVPVYVSVTSMAWFVAGVKVLTDVAVVAYSKLFEATRGSSDTLVPVIPLHVTVSFVAVSARAAAFTRILRAVSYTHLTLPTN